MTQRIEGGRRQFSFPSGNAERQAAAFCSVVGVILWVGVHKVGFAPDDYQYIHSLAPIRSLWDIFRPFWEADLNLSVFRPVANATMVFDFLFWGWNATAFHLTNLCFHAVAIFLVFYLLRRAFDLSLLVSLWSTLLFAVSASHDFNLVVDTARADILVTIFGILVLLCEQKASVEKKFGWRITALIFFGLALASKEIGFLLIPLITWIIYRQLLIKGKGQLSTALKLTFPYLIVAIAFFTYRSAFTESLTQSGPAVSEGSHSIVAAIRNAVYGLGYILLPLDLDSATTLLRTYKTEAFLCAALLMLLIVGFVWKFQNKDNRRALVFPILFSIATGFIVLQSFERWRLYMPSIGVYAMLIVILDKLWYLKRKAVQITVLVFAFSYGVFHVSRSLEAQHDWEASTTLLQRLKADLRNILNESSDRPVSIVFLTVPAKLGSGTVMQIGQQAIAEQAEAERIGQDREGLLSSEVSSASLVEVLALNRDEGFKGLKTERISTTKYLLSSNSPHLYLRPSGATNTRVAARDNTLSEEESIQLGPGKVTVLDAEGSMARKVEVELMDSTSLRVAFDGEKFVRLD